MGGCAAERSLPPLCVREEGDKDLGPFLPPPLLLLAFSPLCSDVCSSPSDTALLAVHFGASAPYSSGLRMPPPTVCAHFVWGGETLKDLCLHVRLKGTPYGGGGRGKAMTGVREPL